MGEFFDGVKKKFSFLSPRDSRDRVPPKQRVVEDAEPVRKKKDPFQWDPINFPPEAENYSQLVCDCSEKTDDSENVEFFNDILKSEGKINLSDLKRRVWTHGCPQTLRHIVWPILLEYVPPWPFMFEEAFELRFRLYNRTLDSLSAYYEQNEHLLELVQLIRSSLINLAFRIPTMRSKKLAVRLDRIILIVIREIADQYFQDAQYQETHVRIVLPLIHALLYKFREPSENFQNELSDLEVSQLEASIYHCASKLIQKNSQLSKSSPNFFVALFEKYMNVVNPSFLGQLKALQVDYASLVINWTNSLLIDQIKKMPLIVHLWDRYLATSFVDCHIQVYCIILNSFEHKMIDDTISQQLLLLNMSDWNFKEINKIVKQLQEFFPFTQEK